jgi:hypothetical protein
MATEESVMASGHTDVVDWRSEYSEAERLAATATPEQALAPFDRATAALLHQQGYDLGSMRGQDFDLAQVADGLDPEMALMYMEAHAILAMHEDGRKVGEQTLALAFEAYRTVHEVFAARA